MTEFINAREELLAAADWLAFQHEDLSFGIKSAEDAIKIWRYWRKHEQAEELPEFCDECDSDADRKRLLAHTKKALGYDPWIRAIEIANA